MALGILSIRIRFHVYLSLKKMLTFFDFFEGIDTINIMVKDYKQTTEKENEKNLEIKALKEALASKNHNPIAIQNCISTQNSQPITNNIDPTLLDNSVVQLRKKKKK